MWSSDGHTHTVSLSWGVASSRVGLRATSLWVFFAGPTHPTPLTMRPPPAPRPRRRRARAASWTTSAACSMTWRTSWTPCWSDVAHAGSARALARTLTFTSGWAPLGEAQASRAAGGGGGQVQGTARQTSAAMRLGRVMLPSPCTSTTPAPRAQAGRPAWRIAWSGDPRALERCCSPVGTHPCLLLPVQ